MRTAAVLLLVLVACTKGAAPDDAAARTLARGSARVVITVRLEAPGRDPVVATGDGGFDVAAGRRWLRLDLSPLVEAAGGPGAALARAGTIVDGDDVYVLDPTGRWHHVTAPGAGLREPFVSSGPDALLRDPEGGVFPGMGHAVRVRVVEDDRGLVQQLILRPQLPAGSLTITVTFEAIGEPVEAPVPA